MLNRRKYLNYSVLKSTLISTYVPYHLNAYTCQKTPEETNMYVQEKFVCCISCSVLFIIFFISIFNIIAKKKGYMSVLLPLVLL